MMRLILLVLLNVALGLASLPARGQSIGLAQIAELAKAGQCREAFAILESLEFQMAGNATFDLLFAHCALEVGETGIAMLALDRVLVTNPADQQARFLLARAYFLLDDLDGARREFELLKSLNPAPALGDSVGQYLDAMAARDPEARSQLGGYLAFAIGHDTNVTDGTANELIYFPGPNLVFSPDASDLEDADNYANLAFGADYLHRFGRRHDLYARADVNLRGHDERDKLDYGLVTLRTGYRNAGHNRSFRLGLAVSDWRLDDAGYQDGESLEFEWRNTFARRNQIGLAAWYSRYRHDAESDAVLDYDDARLRLAYLRLLGRRGDRRIGFSVDIGHEDDVNGRDDGNRDYIALGLNGRMPLSKQTSGFVLLSSQRDEYDRTNPLFAEKRSESQVRFATGITWKLREHTSLRATLAASDTDSNFALYDSSGEDFSITLRHDFR